MISGATAARVLYGDLDTSFVNLWALLRYLSQQQFVGRVHVQLENYEANVFLDGSSTPLVHEIDRAAGTDVIEEAALHRLVLRVRETPGKITVYQNAGQASALHAEAGVANVAAVTAEAMRSAYAKAETENSETVVPAETTAASIDECHETLRLSGELIAAVERAAVGRGTDFSMLFRDARVALADDYPFLDLLAGLRYENGVATINSDSVPPGFVAGVGESLRRVVDQFATGEKTRRARERVALELARVARKNSEGLTRTGFQEQLDLIAGTRVV
jgi:hypothetical protein